MPPLLDEVRSLSRRGLLKGASASALLAALMPAASRSVWANPVFAGNPFTLGVASGDPLPDGVVLWTRIAPDPLNGGGMPMQAVSVTWEVASDDRMRSIVQSGEALARPELGHSVHVEVGGLEPARPYWYRFRVGREASRVGRTKTAPAPGAMSAALRFANAGCQRYEDGYFTAWRHLAREELDFVFHYGDYIYEYRARNGTAPTVRETLGDEIYTLGDYRNRYALYKRDADLQAAHAAHPFLSSFDDHEVDNNWAGEISEEDGSGASPAVPPEYFALRKQMAFHAWYENMPVRQAQLPRGPAIAAYRTLRYGQLAQINVLDTRQYRDDQPCGDGTKEACPALLNPNAQMLGPDQERWLFDGLARSDTTWNVLAQQVMMMRRDVSTGTNAPQFSMDKWDAYPAARDRLMRHLEAARVKGLVVLTGDIHNAWAGDLKADFLNPASATLGTEFIATSISTNGDGFDIDEPRRRLLDRNPHLKFFNNRRGYAVHEATKDRMVVRFRAVDSVSQPGAPLVTKASYAVEAAKPGVVDA